MKKFLSLVLALVMTMSLVTISAGAKDFTDGSKIQYKEAVDVISELGIVDGYSDGDFKPSDTLTRGAAAKIICNLVLGPTTAGALVADAAPYKDVPTSNTFAGYIAYCQQQGIISGYADGSFRPGATLTSYAFMKMLLGALGYDADIEGYVGDNWSVAVAKRALNIELDDSLVGSFNGIKAVTREEACLYAFNTLTADMVDYDSRTTVNVGGAEVVIAGSKAEPVEYVGKKDEKIYDDGIQQFAEKYFTDLELKDFEENGETDDFGRPARTWYDDSDKIGTYAETADVVYHKDVKGKDAYKALDLSKNYNYSVVVDGKPLGTFAVDKSNEKKIAKASGVDADTNALVGDGSLVEFYKDEKVVTVINSYIMQVDGEYDEDDEELTISPVSGDLGEPITQQLTDDVLSLDDLDNLASFKDEDYVIVNLAWDSGNKYEVKSITLAEKVTATVTEYVDDDAVTAGGSEYGYNVTADSGKSGNYQYTLKEEAELYLDPYGNVLWADGVENDGSYVFIAEFGTSTNLSSTASLVAYGYFLDGTEAEITINKLNGDVVKAKDLDPSSTTGYNTSVNGHGTGWYRFSEQTSGKYNLTSVTNATVTAGTVGTDEYVTNYDAFNTKLGDGSIRGTKDTKFIVLDEDDDVSIYSGIKNVADTKVITSDRDYKVSVVKNGSYAKYVFIDVGDNGSVKGGNSSGDVIFLMKLDKYGTDVDDDNYYRYKAIKNGEETKVKVDTDLLSKLSTQGVDPSKPGAMITSVEYDSKDYVTDFEYGRDWDTDDFVYGTISGGQITHKKQTVVLDGTTTGETSYYLADDATIFLIDDTDSVSKVSGSKLASSFKSISGYSVNVYGVMDGDGAVKTLFVWTQKNL